MSVMQSITCDLCKGVFAGGQITSTAGGFRICYGCSYKLKVQAPRKDQCNCNAFGTWKDKRIEELEAHVKKLQDMIVKLMN